ncbi:hypothetical protein DICPUDRAFT_149445 [Dictyostelium purpureum]|uniref:DUF4042 domain-containing protein n=1 Tax=Dictyostelium purpureum TaxID=5786 RepID=F0ZDR7_DICPU|nr:uncharacterized protein DICPUDRAFT_149445 [Dictyostelium purpureum]EGC37894.1 hypothetical protein DICPUDRAFT_149445 [Dictyostelium purpureum]|eukprot:XP_003285554.1 hypothetical protein DICPUDRAFT_149445 [Dictyostelium purpureum]
MDFNNINNTNNVNNFNTPLLEKILKLQKPNLGALLNSNINNNNNNNKNNINNNKNYCHIQHNQLNDILNCLNELLIKFQSKAYLSPPQQPLSSSSSTTTTTSSSTNTLNSSNSSVSSASSISSTSSSASIVIPTEVLIRVLIKFCSVIPTDINYHRIQIYSSPLNLSIIQLPLKLAQLVILISRHQNSISFSDNTNDLEALVNFFLFIIKTDKPPQPTPIQQQPPINNSNTVNINLRIESLKALSSLLHNNGPHISNRLQQPLVDCLLELSNFTDSSIDQESKRIATVSLGNLCMQSGTKLSKYYISIFDRLFSNLERVTSLLNTDKYLIKAKGILDQRAKSLYNILKTLMFYGVNIASSTSQVLVYQYQFDYLSRKKKSHHHSPTNSEGGSNEVERSTGLTSSDSDIDERYNLSKLRFLTITLLNTMVKHSPKVFFGYWSLFLPSTPFPLTPTVFTSMLNDPDIKIKIASANLLQTIIDGSKDFLVAVNSIKPPSPNFNSTPTHTSTSVTYSPILSRLNKNTSNNNNNNSNSNYQINSPVLTTHTHSSFTTFSQNLTSILREIHNGLINILNQDPNLILPSFHQQILRCVSTLIVNCPYEKLNSPSLLINLFTSITPYVQHKDQSIQLIALICIKQLFDITPLSPKELNPILYNNSDSTSKNNNSILTIILGFLINDTSLTININNNNDLIPQPLPLPSSSNNQMESIKIESIQIFGALTKHCFSIFINYAEKVYNTLFSILNKEITNHLNNSNNNANSGGSSSSSSLLIDIPLSNYCLKTFDEITKAIHDAHKTNFEFDNNIVEIQFWNLFFNILPSLTIDPLPQIRSSICNIFSNITSTQFDRMKKNQQMHLVSVVLGLIFDDSHIVRASACRAVGILIKIESLHDDATFLSNAASCLTKSMGDVNINVKIKACWSLANLCDHLVSLKSNETVFNDIPQQILSKVLESLLNSSFDNPKIRSNVVRALGNFARFAGKSVLYNVNETSTFIKVLGNSNITGPIGGNEELNNNNDNNINNNQENINNNDDINKNNNFDENIINQKLPPQFLNSTTLKKDAIILDRIVDSLLKNAQEPSSSFNFVKVKWNACYALGNIFYNPEIEFPDKYGSCDKWLPQIYHTLIGLMKTCKNFKTRINATASLATQTHTRLKYSSFYREVLEAVIDSLKNINSVSDTSEFQYRDNLEKQLEIALIHMVSEMKFDEITSFSDIFFNDTDIIVTSFQKHQIILPSIAPNTTTNTNKPIPPLPIETDTPSSTPIISSTAPPITSSANSNIDRPTLKEYQKAIDVIKEFCKLYNNMDPNDPKKLQLSQLCLLFDFSESNYQRFYSKLQQFHLNNN